MKKLIVIAMVSLLAASVMFAGQPDKARQDFLVDDPIASFERKEYEPFDGDEDFRWTRVTSINGEDMPFDTMPLDRKEYVEYDGEYRGHPVRIDDGRNGRQTRLQKKVNPPRKYKELDRVNWRKYLYREIP
ncbi:MAG: hypothetical protein P9L92_06765 [Candidatus Electryonea clarkiae]|nr:hypothetical protein [Candidatus Electryonea clarkiae]MDP8286705.1 hypothetical protein [Candidatus Electryonea clarkiae]